jgi:hypothetical protein
MFGSVLFCFLACVGFVDLARNFGVLAYLFLFANSFSGIKLILDVNFVTEETIDFFYLPCHPRTNFRNLFCDA